MKKLFVVLCICMMFFLHLVGMNHDKKQRCKKVFVKEEFKPTILFQPKRLAVLVGERIYNKHYRNKSSCSLDLLRTLPDGAALYIANNSNDQKDTLLHVMAREGNEAEVEYLLKISVDPKEDNIHHETPLFLAGKHRHLGIFKTLFSAGGYRFKYFAARNDPINFLVSMPNREAFLFFKYEIAEKAMKEPSFQENEYQDDIELKFPYTWIRKAVRRRGHFNFLKYLFNKRDEEMNQGFLLHKAAKQGLEDHLAFLIKKNFFVINAENYMGRPAINSAVRGGSINCIALLLSHGALLQSNNMAHPPLTVAARSAQLGIVKYLLAHGADVNVEDELGNVSLYYAVQKNDVEMVKELFSSPVLDITHSSIEYDDDTDQEIIKLIKQKKKKIKSK